MRMQAQTDNAVQVIDAANRQKVQHAPWIPCSSASGIAALSAAPRTLCRSKQLTAPHSPSTGTYSSGGQGWISSSEKKEGVAP